MITIKSSDFLIHNDLKDIYDLDIYRNDNEIVIKNSHLVCPQFYFKKEGNSFIVSTDFKVKGIKTVFDPILNIKRNSTERVFTPPLNIKHSMWGIDGKFQKMLNIETPELPYKVINNWSEIRINRSGELEVKPNVYSRLYSVDIEDSRNLIMLWKEKYSDIVSDYCRRNVFIPTLTGGCDTRILTYFWRNFNLSEYRLRAVKKDGKNNVEKGRIEIEIAEKVIDKLGLKMTRCEEPPEGKVSMSGTYTESTQKQILLNDRNFVTNVINRCNFEWYQICPFMDDLYLMIKPHRLYEMRVLFMLMFCPDLLDIEIISEAGQGIYDFDYFKGVIDDMKGLIWKWKKNA